MAEPTDEELSTPPAPPPVVSRPWPIPPPMSTAPSTAAGTIQSIFVGKGGIRAGWSLLIFIALMILAFIPIGIALGIAIQVFHFKFNQDNHSAGMIILGEAIMVFAVSASTIGMAVIERRPILSYGFTDRRALPRLASGFAIGFLAISLLMAALCAGGWMQFHGFALSGLDIPLYAVLWGIAFFMTGLSEELLFRGYPQFTLTRGINFWAAAAILSVTFGLVHMGNMGENAVGVGQVIAAGLLFVVSLRMTGSLLWAVGMHAGWDWAQSYFYGVGDSGLVVPGHLLNVTPHGNPLFSGGSVGPEGSIFSLFVLIALTLGIWLFWRDKMPPAPHPAPPR